MGAFFIILSHISFWLILDRDVNRAETEQYLTTKYSLPSLLVPHTPYPYRTSLRFVRPDQPYDFLYSEIQKIKLLTLNFVLSYRYDLLSYNCNLESYRISCIANIYTRAIESVAMLLTLMCNVCLNCKARPCVKPCKIYHTSISHQLVEMSVWKTHVRFKKIQFHVLRARTSLIHGTKMYEHVSA